LDNKGILDNQGVVTIKEGGQADSHKERHSEDYCKGKRQEVRKGHHGEVKSR
jgi:hypothetical protein